MTQALKTVCDVHGTTAKMSMELIEMNRNVQSSVAWQRVEIVCIGRDVVDG